MLFLYWFIGFICSILIYMIGLIIIRFFKKQKLINLNNLISFLINTCSSLLFSFILCLIMYFVYSRIGVFNSVLLFMCLNLTLTLINPYKVYKQIKNESLEKKNIVIAGISIVFFLIEIFGLNTSAYNNNLEQSSFDLSSDTTLNITGSLNEDGSYTFKSNEYIELNIDSNARYFTFETHENNVSELIYVKFYYLTNLNIYNATTQYQMNPGSSLTARIEIPTLCRGNKTKIYFTNYANSYETIVPFTLKTISINAPQEFHFSAIRFLLVIGLTCFFSNFRKIFFNGEVSEENVNDVRLPKWFKRLDKYKKAYVVSGILVVLALIIFNIYAFCNQSLFFYTYEYVEKNIQSNSVVDIYQDLTYSILHGHINLTIRPDETLINAENAGINVYSSTIRKDLGISYIWDHAYYHGNYYSYYGVLPVFIVYIPIYFLSGMNLICRSLYTLSVGFILILYCVYIMLLEIDRHISKDNTNFKLFHIIYVCSFILMLGIDHLCLKDGYFHEGIYHTPIVFGIIEITLFIFFTLKAYKNKEHRLKYLSFAGLFYAMIPLTRPNLCLSIIFMCPLYFKMLFDKNVEIKKRLISFIPLFSVLIVGFTLTFIYNYSRFDSILEFGQSYQMNNDQLTTTFTKNTISMEKLFPAIVHYFFQGPYFYDSFPYIVCSSTKFSFDITYYITGSYGMFLMPIFLLMLIAPFCFKDNKPLRWTFSLIPVFLLIFTWTTYSSAGVCFRYLIENYYFATIASISVLFFFIYKYKDEKRPLQVPCGMIIVLFITTFMCFNLTFDSFDGMNIGDLNGLLIEFKDAFTPFLY